MENENEGVTRMGEPANAAGQPAAERNEATPQHAKRTEPHTDGPWKVGAHLCSRRFNVENAVEVQSADGYMVAVLFKCNRSMEDNGEDAANARLIAAAPELFSALRSLVSYLRRAERWPVKSEHMAYLQDAETAIAKAEAR